MAERTLGILVKATGAAQAAGLIGKVDSSVQKLGSRSGMVGRLGSSMGRLTSGVGALAGSIGPLVGVAGITGIGAAFGTSLTKAEEFGVTVSKLTNVLNLDTETVSALSDTLDKFGVAGNDQVTVLSRLEKNAGLLATAAGKNKPLNDAVIKSTEKLRVAQVALSEAESKHHAKQSTILAARYRVADAERQLADARKKGGKAVDASTTFEKQYGFNLHLANGKIADANTLLLRSADYFNGTATATDKNIVLTKLYGKAWTNMIPVLALGSKGIKEEEANAIHLTQTQLSNITKFKTAQRNFADTIGDLQVKVGAELMPTITGALQTASTWLDSHGDEVVAFFRDAGQFAGQLAEDAGKVFGALSAGWNMVPAPLRQLLLEGLIAGKVTKFLFDFGPMDAAKLGSRLLGGVAGGIFSRGGSPATPVFVADVTGGAGVSGVGGGGWLKTALGLGVGGLGGLFIAGIAPIVLSQLAIAVAGGPEGVAARDTAGRQATASARGIPGQVPQRPSSGPINVAGDWYARNNRMIGDFGAPHPGSLNFGAAGGWSVLGVGADARKNQAMQGILSRALAHGFRPSQAAVTATYERNAERAANAQKAAIDRVNASIKAADTHGELRAIELAIKGINIPAPIVNVGITASDIQKVQIQRRNAVKAHGSRNSRIGGPTVSD